MTDQLCAKASCERNAKTRGYCHSCYNGLHIAGKIKKRTIAERFYEKVSQGGECWEWIAGKNASGYGIMGFSGKCVLAHRVSFEMHKGAIPDGLCVLHSCDNPSCVNPAHLSLGTQAENIRQRDERGRTGRTMGVLGEQHYGSKLTESAVRDIRSSSLSRYELADKYGVSHVTIGKVIRGESWRHLL